MLTGLELGVYRFVMRTLETLRLPEFKGTVLRGGFGTTFKKLACVHGSRLRAHMPEISCGECSESVRCPYKIAFEPSPPEGSTRLRNLQDISRPFVLRIPSDPRTVIPPGDRLEWELVLIGNARRLLPYFVVTFKALGESGFGQWHEGRRSRAVLETVHLHNPLTGESEVVYEGGPNLLKSVDRLVCTGADIKAKSEGFRKDMVSVDFLSITRLKHQDTYVRKPEFHVLIRNLLRRVSTLAYFYQGVELDLDFRGLIALAERISLEDVSIRWREFARYSGRTKDTMDFSGFAGCARYSGELSPFLHLLLFGSFLNVGKGSTFGLGQYALRT